MLDSRELTGHKRVAAVFDLFRAYLWYGTLSLERELIPPSCAPPHLLSRSTHTHVEGCILGATCYYVNA
jgi:hypothetical protein